MWIDKLEIKLGSILTISDIVLKVEISFIMPAKIQNGCQK